MYTRITINKERGIFISKTNKKKVLGFETAIFHLGGECSFDRATGVVSARPENQLYIAKQLQFSNAKMNKKQ